MFGRRWVALVLFVSLLASGPVGGLTSVSAKQATDCAQLSLYVDEIQTAGEQIDAQEANGPDMDHIETWTQADFDQTLAFYDQLLVTVQEIVPPPIAAAFHQIYVEGIQLAQEMFATMRTEGAFAMIGFMEPLAELNQQIFDASLPLEEACDLAIFDHDGDGEPEVGAGAGFEAADASPGEAPNAGSSQSEPVAAGSAAMLDSQWELTVLAVTPNATDAVLAYDPSNTPPAAGSQYFIARVKITNTGTEDGSFSNWRLSLEDPSGRTYAPFIDYCGFIPDELPADTLAPGESAEGNVCWAIPAAEAASTAALVIYDGDAFESNRIYFSLDVPVEADGSDTGDTPASGGFANAVGSAGAGAVSGFGTPEPNDAARNR